MKVIDASVGAVRDYSVRITRSDHKERFQAALTPVDSTACAATAWFVDEREVICTAHPLC